MKKARWNDAQMIEVVAKSFSVAEVLRALGLKVTGANYKTIHRAVQRLALDTSHWTGQGHLKGKSHDWSKSQKLEEILIEKSTYTNTFRLKRRLLKAGLLLNKCYICSINEWLGKKLVLQLDHMNGDHFDNRIENLRLLCPNCHSQTETFAGKNK